MKKKSLRSLSKGIGTLLLFSLMLLITGEVCPNLDESGFYPFDQNGIARIQWKNTIGRFSCGCIQVDMYTTGDLWCFLFC